MNHPVQQNSDYLFFRDGGQTGAVMRSVDWKHSSMGAPALWPQSLKNAIRLILDNAAPMYIAWGKGLVQFYNDGYLPILGQNKHPCAIGASTRETFREIWPMVGPMFDQVLKGQSIFNEDLNLPLERNGKISDSYFTFSYSPLRDDNGIVAGVFVVAFETTSKVISHQEIQRSRKELHDFFMQAPVPMVMLEGPNHFVTLANPPYVRLSGREVTGKTIAEAFPRGEADSFIPLLDGVYQTGVPFIGKELPLQLPDDSGAMQNLWIDIGYYPFRGANNAVKGVYALVHDVTHQVLARNEAQQSETRALNSEKQLLDVLESTADGFIELDKNYKILRVNKNQERISGMSRNLTVGRNHWDVWPKESIPKIWEAYQKVIQENVPMRVEDFNSALQVWLDVDAYPTPTGGIAAFFRDVTGQKDALSKIKYQRDRFDRLAAASGIGVWYCDLPFNELIWDEKVKEHFWLPANAKVTIDTFYERIHPQDRELTRHAVENSIQSHTRYDIVYRTMNPDNENDVKWIRAVGWTDYDPSGKSIRFDGITLEVTEAVVSRQALENTANAVQNERENIRNLFKQTPEMVCVIKGPQHVFEFVNEAHIKALGFDATGKTVREAQPESVEVHGILDNVFKTGITAELREIPVTLGDHLRYFDLTYAAKRDPNGIIDGIMILGTEITAQVAARISLLESQRKYQLLFDFSPVPKWVIDIDTMKYVDVNVAAIQHYGYSKEEFLAMSPIDIRPEEEKLRFIEWMKNEHCSRLESQTYDKRRTHIKKDGSLIEVEVSALDLNLDGRKVRVCAMVDITDRVQSEARQQDLLAKLVVAKEDAEKANRSKTAFLANMSHEIRTPMNAILGFTEILRDMSLGDKDRKDALSRIDRSGRGLLKLIDDILDISKVEAGKLSIEKVRFSPFEIVTEVASLLRLQAEQKGIQLKTRISASVPEVAHSDQARIRQILTNLIGNAIKFTATGEVVIEVDTETDTNGTKQYLIFEVTDTGIGIAHGDHNKLFQAFAQADESIVRKFGGTGLGLVLSQRLCQQLGGDLILLESQINQGSKFLAKIEAGPFQNLSLELTPDRENAPSLAQEGSNIGLLNDVRILVVDDAPDNQLLMRLFLESAGALVDSAGDGEEAISKASSRGYDLILMDIQMPRVDGLQATRRLRSRGYTRPILALTAHAMKEEIMRSLEAGCNEHITKPIARLTLLTMAKKYLSLPFKT